MSLTGFYFRDIQTSDSIRFRGFFFSANRSTAKKECTGQVNHAFFCVYSVVFRFNLLLVRFNALDELFEHLLRYLFGGLEGGSNGIGIAHGTDGAAHAAPVEDRAEVEVTAAEDEFLSKKPHDWHRHTLSGDTMRAKGQITKYANKAGVLKPRWSEDYQQFLISKGIFGR